MAYVDTSTLVKLVIDEAGTDRAGQIWDDADHRVSVALVEVEARAALAAARRAGRITLAHHRRAKASVAQLLADLDIIEVRQSLVSAAADLAELERLRGYDALHLAGALQSRADVLTSADDALCAAAARHGILVANPLDGEDPSRPPG